MQTHNSLEKGKKLSLILVKREQLVCPQLVDAFKQNSYTLVGSRARCSLSACHKLLVRLSFVCIAASFNFCVIVSRVGQSMPHLVIQIGRLSLHALVLS